MVPFGYFVIFVLFAVLKQHVNFVQCSSQECDFYAKDNILDCSNRGLERIPEDVLSSKYEKM